MSSGGIRLLGRALVVVLVTAGTLVLPIDASHGGSGLLGASAAWATGSYGVNDYPDKDAVDCSSNSLGGSTSWCKNGSWLSPRKFAYRNCTDFVAWRLGISFGDLAFPKGDGNARGWKQGAINSGYEVSSTPRVGAVAWWWTGSPNDFGHLAVVTSVNPNGTANVEQYNFNTPNDGKYSTTNNVTANAYLYIKLGPAVGAVGSMLDGSFIHDSSDGRKYRLVGGAPLYVNDWSAFGGPQPVTEVSHDQLLALPTYPTDGTYVQDTTTALVYRIVGGAPLYVSNWNNLGGIQPTIGIDTWDLNNLDNPYSHLRSRPIDGTFITSSPGGSLYRIVGGAPIYVSSWQAVGGTQLATAVDVWDLDNSNNPAAHLNFYPSDGSFVTTNAGYIYRFAGGAPLVVSNWNAVGGPQSATGIDQAAIDNADGVIPWNHIHRYPVDGTLLSTLSQNVYRVVGGAIFPVSVRTVSSGTQPPNLIDTALIDNAGGLKPLIGLRPYPANSTVVKGNPSGTYWTFAGGCRIATKSLRGAIDVDDSGLTFYPLCKAKLGSSPTPISKLLPSHGPINSVKSGGGLGGISPKATPLTKRPATRRTIVAEVCNPADGLSSRNEKGLGLACLRIGTGKFYLKVPIAKHS